VRNDLTVVPKWPSTPDADALSPRQCTNCSIVQSSGLMHPARLQVDQGES